MRHKLRLRSECAFAGAITNSFPKAINMSALCCLASVFFTMLLVEKKHVFHFSFESSSHGSRAILNIFFWDVSTTLGAKMPQLYPRRTSFLNVILSKP